MQIVRLGGLDHHLAGLGIGELQHPVPQKAVDRRQAVEPEQADERPQGRAVDQKGEEDEAGRQHRDEVAGLARQQGIFGHGERQDQGERPPQAAPGDGELVDGADRLGEPREAQEWHEEEEHRKPRGEGRGDQDRNQFELAPVHVEQQLRHQDRGQEKDERMGPEGDLLPEIGEERPVVRRDPGPTEGADRQAGREHRHHPRDIEQPLRRDEDEIGERDRQRSLGQPVVARPGNDREKRPASQRAQHRAADESADEFDRALAERGRAAREDDPEQHRIEHDRRRIVEQRFARDQPRQARRRPDVAENRDDRGGVGGRDDRAEQEADGQRHARERPERKPDDRGGDQRRDHRKHEDRGGVLEDAPHVAGEGRLEHQERQEDVDEGLGAQRQIGEQPDELAEMARQGPMQQEAGDRAHRRADHGEEHDRRELQPFRERLAQRHDDQERPEHGQDEDDIEHGSSAGRSRRGTAQSAGSVGGARSACQPAGRSGGAKCASPGVVKGAALKPSPPRRRAARAP